MPIEDHLDHVDKLEVTHFGFPALYIRVECTKCGVVISELYTKDRLDTDKELPAYFTAVVAVPPKFALIELPLSIVVELLSLKENLLRLVSEGGELIVLSLYIGRNKKYRTDLEDICTLKDNETNGWDVSTYLEQPKFFEGYVLDPEDAVWDKLHCHNTITAKIVCCINLDGVYWKFDGTAAPDQPERILSSHCIDWEVIQEWYDSVK